MRAARVKYGSPLVGDVLAVIVGVTAGVALGDGWDTAQAAREGRARDKQQTIRDEMEWVLEHPELEDEYKARLEENQPAFRQMITAFRGLRRRGVRAGAVERETSDSEMPPEG